MPVLDNAIWLTASDGSAESGSTTISDGGSSTVVTGTFTPNAWDSSQSGQAVSEFGAFGVITPITAVYEFSNPVTELSFNFDHVSASGTTYDDLFVIRIYDDNGVLLPASTVIAGISGMTHTNVYANPDGSVSIEADGTAQDLINLSLAGPISQMDIEFGPGPDGTQSGGAGFGDFTFSVPEIICFARDTHIETSRGLVAVQDLEIGDLVLTRNNGFQAIRWLGSNEIHGSGIMAPVTIAKGAMGNTKDLKVSQQHRILITGWRAELLFGESEVLAAAKHLTNGDTIYIAPQKRIEYHHILFDQHEIIFANGIPTESFFPSTVGIRSIGADARDELFALFPQLRNNPDAYGLTAFPTLKAHEVAVLAREL